MLRPFRLQLIAASAVVVLCLGSPLVLLGPGDRPHPIRSPAEASALDAAVRAAHQAIALPDECSIAEKSYVGTNQCFVCHRRQADAWSETKHAHAFTNVPEKYQNDPACLKCHVTGFGEPGGYVAGTDKDLLMVGCESCHGPGAGHIDAAQRFILATPDEEEKAEKEMRDTIVKTPGDSICSACHVTQAHRRHPAYEGQPAQQVVSRSVDPCGSVPLRSARTTSPAAHSSRFNIKTCGGCHYDEYQQWRSEQHFDLSAMLPAAYRNDQNCHECHPTAGAVAMRSMAGADLHHQWIGVACETCHGPGLEHVRFNRRYISGPPLGPKLEQAARHAIREGKPASTCVQCHIREGHRKHPEFDEE